MANPSRPRRFKSAHYARVRRLEHWRKLWIADPNKMEAIRKIATEAAARSRRDRQKTLAQIIATQWPQTLTPEEFKARLADLASQVVRPKGKRPYQPDSLRRRLTTSGLVLFNPDLGVYVNTNPISIASPQQS